ncbi:MAG: hypothetical protein E7070_10700 [Bacteroidales bacterium]|jgi:hypothetical protein|nr:hypothetical protein [Bacteroidales bacterium]
MNRLYIIILSAFLSATALAQERNTTSAKNDSSAVAVAADSAAHKGIESRLSINLGDEPVEIYNLCGRFLTNNPAKLRKGVYVVKQNGSSRKMVVR